jgi:hypothetical protein
MTLQNYMSRPSAPNPLRFWRASVSLFFSCCSLIYGVPFRNKWTESKASNKVIIFIHRLSSIRDADKIIVLGNGQVEEARSPQKLVSSHTGFPRLVAL